MGFKTSKMGVTLVAISVLIVSLISSGPLSIINQQELKVTAEDITSTTTTWHHDGSNLTAFDGVGDDSWLWEGARPFLSSQGMLNSSMGAIYSPDLGTPPSVACHFGPIRYHTFTSPFNLLQLRRFQVEIEIDPAGISQAIGSALVMLHDESHSPIVGIKVADGFAGDSNVHPRAIWFYPNGTEGYQPTYSPGTTPYRDSILLELNSTGVYVTMSDFGCLKVVDIEEINGAMVSYISIMITGAKEDSESPYPFPDIVRIHDIQLTWSSSSSDKTSPTVSPTNTTGWNWEDLPDPVVFLITGMAGTILVLVIVIGCIGRRRGP